MKKTNDATVFISTMASKISLKEILNLYYQSPLTGGGGDGGRVIGGGG